MTKRLWIETVGCQMNVLDSELVVAALRRQESRGAHFRLDFPEPKEPPVRTFITLDQALGPVPAAE